MCMTDALQPLVYRIFARQTEYENTDSKHTVKVAVCMTWHESVWMMLWADARFFKRNSFLHSIFPFQFKQHIEFLIRMLETLFYTRPHALSMPEIETHFKIKRLRLKHVIWATQTNVARSLVTMWQIVFYGNFNTLEFMLSAVAQ